VATVNAGAWLIATGEDLRYPTTEGGARHLQTRLTHRYLDRVIGAATRDQRVNTAFLNVLQLAAPPTALFRPGVAAAALLRGGASGAATPPAAPAGRPIEAAGQPAAGDEPAPVGRQATGVGR